MTYGAFPAQSPEANCCPSSITAPSATVHLPASVFPPYSPHIHEPSLTKHILFCSSSLFTAEECSAMDFSPFFVRKWGIETRVTLKIRVSFSYQKEVTALRINFYTLFSFSCIFLIISHYLSSLSPFPPPSTLSSSISPSISLPTSHTSTGICVLPFCGTKPTPEQY